jgi:hypothetical protein
MKDSDEELPHGPAPADGDQGPPNSTIRQIKATTKPPHLHPPPTPSGTPPATEEIATAHIALKIEGKENQGEEEQTKSHGNQLTNRRTPCRHDGVQSKATSLNALTKTCSNGEKTNNERNQDRRQTSEEIKTESHRPKQRRQIDQRM